MKNWVLALLIFGFGVGCYEGLDKIGIFPCAVDGSCPSGRICLKDFLGEPADIDNTNGLCYLSDRCDEDSDCPTDRPICSPIQGMSNNYCTPKPNNTLSPCDDQGSCPEVAGATPKVCLKGFTPPDGVDASKGLCYQKQTCRSGSMCSSEQPICSRLVGRSSRYCTPPLSDAVTPCETGNVCPQLTGDVERFCLLGAEQMTANTGGGLCYWKQTCNVYAQDCSSDFPKCARVLVGENIENLCIPQLEQRRQGETCTPSSRTGTEGSEYAYDECAVGYGCSTAKSVCRKYCDSASDCGAGFGCILQSGVGFCEQICSPFDGSAADCPPGNICRLNSSISGNDFFCFAEGNAAVKTEGQVCQSTTECAEGLTCHGSLCTAVCDSSNPCSNGRPCKSNICRCRVFSDDCGSGYTCEPTSNGFTKCSPVGPLARDELCSDRGDDCGRNLDCRGNATAKIFACRELCDDNNSCSYGDCGSLSGFDNNLGLCKCSPFDSSSCPSGQFCSFFGSTTSGLGRVCADYGGLSEGDRCGGDNGLCGRDSVCWGDDNGRFCRKMCDDNNSCRQGECTPVTYLPNNAGVCFGS